MGREVHEGEAYIFKSDPLLPAAGGFVMPGEFGYRPPVLVKTTVLGREGWWHMRDPSFWFESQPLRLALLLATKDRGLHAMGLHAWWRVAKVVNPSCNWEYPLNWLSSLKDLEGEMSDMNQLKGGVVDIVPYYWADAPVVPRR